MSESLSGCAVEVFIGDYFEVVRRGGGDEVRFGVQAVKLHAQISSCFDFYFDFYLKGEMTRFAVVGRCFRFVCFVSKGYIRVRNKCGGRWVSVVL